MKRIERAVGALLLALVAAAGLVLAQQALGRLDSDALYSEALYRDLSRSWRLLSGWVYQPAPAFFPDVSTYAILRSLTGALGPAYALYGLLFWAAFLGLLWAIFRRGSPDPAGIFPPFTLSAGLFSAFLLCHPALTQLLFPGFHTGTLLTGLALLWLVLGSLDGLIPGGRILALSGLAALGEFSDRILAPQFLLPIGLSLTWMAWKKRQAGLLVPLASLALGAVLGEAALRLFHAGSMWGHVPHKDYIGDLLIHPKTFAWGDLPGIAARFPLAAPCLAGTLFLSFWVSREAAEAPSPSRFLSLFCLTCVLLTPLNALALAEGGYSRYLWPFFFFGLTGIFLLGTWSPTRFLAAAAVVTVLLGFFLWRQALTPDFRTPYPAKTEWLDSMADKHGLKRIYTDYWNAKFQRLLAHSGLATAPLAWVPGHLFFHSWIENTRACLEAPGGAWPRYQAILMDGLPEEAVLKRLGQPAQREVFGSSQLWIYDRPQDLAFRNFLRSAMDPGIQTVFDAGALKAQAEGRPGEKVSDMALALPPGKPFYVTLKPGSAGDVLELRVDAASPLRVRWFLGGHDAGQHLIPAQADHGLKSFFLDLSGLNPHQGFDKVTFECLGPGQDALNACYLYWDAKG
jgi:hypothetical protein